MESSLHWAAYYIVGLASYFAISGFLRFYWFGARDRSTALFLGIVFLALGLGVNWVFDTFPIWFGDNWKVTPTLAFFRNFFSFGVAALSANFIATAFFTPTDEEQGKEREKLAKEIAKAISDTKS
jgi:hypothetical protein